MSNIDELACDISIGLAVHMTVGDRRALGMADRLLSDDRREALAQRLADHLRRSGWLLDRAPPAAPHSTP